MRKGSRWYEYYKKPLILARLYDQAYNTLIHLSMKISILGTGNLGEALAKALTRQAYHVMIGAKEPEKAFAIAGTFDHYAKGATFANAIHYGEVIILAVPYQSVEETLRNTDSYRGKIVIDATNPLIMDGMPDLALGHTTSGAEQIARMLPEAKVVKALNTAFTETYLYTSFGPSEASMFYCGDDEEAKKVVKKILTDINLAPIDCGPLSCARMLEPMAALLIRLGINMGMGREIAYKLLVRDDL